MTIFILAERIDVRVPFVNVNPWHDGSGEPRLTELITAQNLGISQRFNPL